MSLDDNDIRPASYDVPPRVLGYNDAYGDIPPRPVYEGDLEYESGYAEGLGDRVRDVESGVYGNAE